jgi:hypothetical protein
MPILAPLLDSVPAGLATTRRAEPQLLSAAGPEPETLMR